MGSVAALTVTVQSPDNLILVESLWAQTDQNRILLEAIAGLAFSVPSVAVLRRQWRSCFMRPNVRDCRWNSLSAGREPENKSAASVEGMGGAALGERG